jgi:hypothetical protein
MEEFNGTTIGICKKAAGCQLVIFHANRIEVRFSPIFPK